MSTKFKLGDRVMDPDGNCAIVIHVFEDPQLRHLVAVRFDIGDEAVAMHVDDLRRAREA
jgi:hypothetical protein